MEPHEPVIRPRPEHCISRRDIDADALKVLYRLARRGYISYLVGGGVRDLLLGHKPKDFDISTNAHPNQIKGLFRNCFLIGRRFRLAHIRYGEKVIETSTFRRQPPPNDGDELLQKNDNTFGTPEEDALRRDFTINGLFYCIDTFSVIDFVGGLKDLDEKLVRCIGEPEIRFQEDPVRMIRAVRFASRLDFRIEENAWQAIRTHHSEILKAAPARLVEEIYKLYGYGAGEAAFRLLWRAQLLQDIFPPLHKYLEVHGGDAAPVWRYLSALDKGDTMLHEVTQPLMLATLLYHPILMHHEQAEAADTQAAWIESVRHVTSEILGALKVPRRVVDRLTRILGMQYRFNTRKRQRFNKGRFAAQNYFPEGLALFEIHLAAQGGDFVREAAPWRALYEDQIEKQDGVPVKDRANEAQGDDEESTRASSTRRRRRRRRKKKSSSDTPQQDANGNVQAASESTEAPPAQAEASTQPSTPAASAPADAESNPAGEGDAEAPPKKKRRRRRRRGRKRSNAAAQTTAEEQGNPPAEAQAAEAQQSTDAPQAADTPAATSSKASDSAPSRDKKKRNRKTRRDRHGANMLRDDRPAQEVNAFDAESRAPHWMDEL